MRTPLSDLKESIRSPAQKGTDLSADAKPDRHPFEIITAQSGNQGAQLYRPGTRKTRAVGAEKMQRNTMLRYSDQYSLFMRMEDRETAALTVYRIISAFAGLTAFETPELNREKILRAGADAVFSFRILNFFCRSSPRHG